MDIEQLEVGQKVKFKHSRKGEIMGEVTINEKDSEWMSLTLLNRVTGLNNRWQPRESLSVRKSFCSHIELLPE